MNLDFVADSMKLLGWKNKTSGKKSAKPQFGGMYFDMISFHHYLLHHLYFYNWMVLIKSLPELDTVTLNRLQSSLELIFVRAKSNYGLANFYIYFISPKVTHQALHALSTDSLKLLRYSKKGTGTRKIVVVDEQTHQIHGPYPPYQSFEKQPPFDLDPIIKHALSPEGAVYPLPPVQEDVAYFCDHLRPSSALKLIQDSQRTDLEIYRADALRELGRTCEEEECLNAALPKVNGDELARGQRYKAQILFSKGQVDEAIWLLEKAERNTHNPRLRAAILATKANGYGVKCCFNLAQNAIHQALQIAPHEPRVIFAQSHLYLQMDQRLEARSILEGIQEASQGWEDCYADYELANIALLLGEFDQAAMLAASALDFSEEIIVPFFPLAYLAMLKGDLQEMQHRLDQIEERSPQADSITPLRTELERLRNRSTGQAKGTLHRLAPFPSLIQHRNHCGPSTIELILRYWQGGLDLTDTEIARWVMSPSGGTPSHQAMEFFHLVGFNTLRCIASPEALKKLIDQGFPVIVEEQAAGSYHVTVVIGYDDDAGIFELQDPMTHQVLPLPVEMLSTLRQIHNNSAIVAYPVGKGYEQVLARIGLFPDEVLSLIDRACQALEAGNHALVVDLAQRATQLRPQYGLAWVYWLQSLLQQWDQAEGRLTTYASQLDQVVQNKLTSDLSTIKSNFFSVLQRAHSALPEQEFSYSFEGRALLATGDINRALQAFQKALELSPGNPECLAWIAECKYGLRQVEGALESARQAVKINPASVAGNIWCSRCLAWLKLEHAEYYARVGLDLAPDWWLAHLALAEATYSSLSIAPVPPETSPHTPSNPMQVISQEINTILTRIPNQPDTLALRARLQIASKAYAPAQADLEAALKSVVQGGKLPIPMTYFHINQVLCNLFLQQNLFDQASAQVNKLLEILPDDPYALQIQAAIKFRRLTYEKTYSTSPELLEADFTHARDLYLAAIQASQGDPDLVVDFLHFLLQLGRHEDAVEFAKTFRDQYPNRPNLIYRLGATMEVTGQTKKAAEYMLEALGKEDAVRNSNELTYVMHTILQGLGPKPGQQAISAVPCPQYLNPRELHRSLGLAGSYFLQELGGMARQYLEQALLENPADPEVVFTIGMNFPASQEEQYRLLHQAVYLAPHWTYARMMLTSFLLALGHAQEALDFATGHEYESLGILLEYSLAMYRTGHFEKALSAVERLVFDSSLAGERKEVHFSVKLAVDQKCGDWQKALDTARLAQTQFPKELEFCYQECLALCNLGQRSEANNVLAAAKEEGMDESLSSHAAYEIALAVDDLNSALELARHMQTEEWKKIKAKQDPDSPYQPLLPDSIQSNPVIWTHRYLVLLALLGKENDASMYLNSIFSDRRAWETAAFQLSKTPLNQLTLKCAERTLKIKKITPHAQYHAKLARAIAYRNLGDQKAPPSFEELRQKYPLQSFPYEQLAAYSALDGNLSQAAAFIDHAIACDRSSSGAWLVRGLVDYLRGERATAADDLKRGWNRAAEKHLVESALLWLYWELAGDPPAAVHGKEKALARVQSSYDHRLLEVIQSHLYS
jgi:tetratricopeptide (TPR) repeat protein